MQEFRSSVRFPLSLPVAISGETTAQMVQTQDISAGGVLFHVDQDMAVGSSISFRIVLAAQVLGTEKDVHVNCTGRVVRCHEQDGRKAVAAVIDEYQFERL